MFDATAVDLGNAVATVPSGEVYAGSVSVKFSKLDKVEEGKSYLLPVRVRSASLPVSQGGDVVYFILHKPVRIMKVARVYNNYVRIPLLPGTQFTSVTYEALIYIDFFGNNNTVMGCEGTLISVSVMHLCWRKTICRLQANRNTAFLRLWEPGNGITWRSLTISLPARLPSSSMEKSFRSGLGYSELRFR